MWPSSRALRQLEYDRLPTGGGFMWRVNVQEAFVNMICGSLGAEDREYSIAVLLDTTGGLLAHDGAGGIVAMLSTAHLAAVAYEGRSTDWDLDSLAPRAATSTAEALTALSGLAPRFTFVRCWLLDRMIPVLVAEDYAVEGICLALREVATDTISVLRTVRRLAVAVPALSDFAALSANDLGGPELLASLEKLAGEIRAPYPRARALAHLAALRAGRVTEDALLRWADAIDDPHDRLRFLELAITLSLLAWNQAVATKARAAVAAMETSLDAALAVTRIARSVSPTDFHRLRAQLSEIADLEPTERLRLRTALGARVGIASPLLRFDSQMTTYDMHHRTDLRGWRAWAALTGAALCADALTALQSGDEEDAETDDGEVWRALADPERRRAAVQSLRHRSPRRLDLDASACAAISRMLRAGDAELVADVLTVARQRRPLTEVKGWRGTPDQRVSDLATLLVMEAGQLDEQAVAALPRLLTDADDLVRLRAAHSIAVLSRGRTGRPAHRASLIGASTLASLTRLATSPLPPRLSTDMWWALSDVEHDSIETFRGTLDILAAEPEERLLLLSSIRQLTTPVLPELAQLAASLAEPEQLALLDALEAVAEAPERAGVQSLSRLAVPLRILIGAGTAPVQARAWALLGQAEPVSEAVLREFTRRADEGNGALQLSGHILGAVEGLGYLLQRMPQPPSASTPVEHPSGARADALRVLRTSISATDTELAVLAATALYRAGDYRHLAAELSDHPAKALVLAYGMICRLDAKRLIGPEYYSLVAQVCRFVREPPGLTGRDAEEHTAGLLAALLERAADELISALRPVRWTSRPRHLPSLASLLSVLAELAAIQPAAIRVAAQGHPLLGGRLAEATASSSWLVRQHAARLLIFLGNGDERSTLALLDTAFDTDVVRRAVLTDAVWFDNITPTGFRLLLAAAEDPRPRRSYLSVQLLAVLLAGSTLPDREHMAALAAIQRAITAPGANQPLLAEHAGEIRNVGSIAEAGRQILAELAVGGLPVSEAFGAPQFRLRLPDEEQNAMEFVVSKYPVKPQSLTEKQTKYYQTFEGRQARIYLTNALETAAAAAMAPGVALDELLDQSGVEEPGVEASGTDGSTLSGEG